jgi:hypothetical protein
MYLVSSVQVLSESLREKGDGMGRSFGSEVIGWDPKHTLECRVDDTGRTVSHQTPGSRSYVSGWMLYIYDECT